MGRIKAQRKIERGDYNPTDYEGVYNLFLQAYGDEDLAREAQSNAAKLLVQTSCK
jgi:hypothetical protein